MNAGPIYIAQAGILSALGVGLAETTAALRCNITALGPLRVFPVAQQPPLPVGQINDLPDDQTLPRTHQLARIAAAMAMEDYPAVPEALLIGSTTGGILTSENLLREGCLNPEAYARHGLFSLARDVAEQTGCQGPALTISTACSSGAVALALALRLLRTGAVRHVLAGGVDSLSRLTYHGFQALQLVDRETCRPLDVNRRGIAVAEGAALLLLTTVRPRHPLAVLLGAGLSCDAYHPAAPHPQGRGAAQAMTLALTDAGLGADEIDYINLHGTGTPENDLAEAKAVLTVFPQPPSLSSIKGACGHTLAAAGAIEAVVAGIVLQNSLLPGNTGCQKPDPVLGIVPLLQPVKQPVRTVLSNSFGFGGNNGSLLFGHAEVCAFGKQTAVHSDWSAAMPSLAILCGDCLTGAGLTQATWSALVSGQSVAGMWPSEEIAKALPARLVRRLKRLGRMALLLASAVSSADLPAGQPEAICLGTGWGALSETYDFLQQLFVSREQFPSPTDFVGSVHNSAASQVAMFLQATGANVTVSGGDYSFEQALLVAGLLFSGADSSPATALLLGLDEGHAQLSPLLDASISQGQSLADGGGAFLVSRDLRHPGARTILRLLCYQQMAQGTMTGLARTLTAFGPLPLRYAAIFAGLPAACSTDGEQQLVSFTDSCGGQIPVWRYRQHLGEFASASAQAAVIAAACCQQGMIPGTLLDGEDIAFGGDKKILILGLGPCCTAMEIGRP